MQNSWFLCAYDMLSLSVYCHGYLQVGMNPFDNSRKRKAASMGWCRICKVDCETVEGLDLHSQTREHQQMAMDMVLTIKQQNAKKQKWVIIVYQMIHNLGKPNVLLSLFCRTSNDQSSLEEPKKSRGSGYEVRGNKPWVVLLCCKMHRRGWSHVSVFLHLANIGDSPFMSLFLSQGGLC